MLPKLVRVVVPPVEFRMTPAAGRPRLETPVRSACQPPLTDPPGAMLTVTLPTPFAKIPLLNSPVVVIGPEEVTLMLPPLERAAMPMPFPPWVVMPGPV